MTLTFHPASEAAAQGPGEADVLVVAVPSVGNVGQLAVDLIRSSLASSSPSSSSSVEAVGWLDSPHLVPVVGHEVFDRAQREPPQPPQLCLPLELWASANVAFLQQRAPLLRGRGAAFARELVAWVKRTGAFKRLVLVAGAAPQSEEDVLDPRARLWLSHSSSTGGNGGNGEPPAFLRTWTERLGVRDLGAKASAQATVAPAHTGTAAALLTACQEAGLDATALYFYTDEGNNAEDSAIVAHVLMAGLLAADQGGKQHSEQEQEAGLPPPLVAPRSWDFLFGRRHEEMEVL